MEDCLYPELDLVWSEYEGLVMENQLPDDGVMGGTPNKPNSLWEIVEDCTIKSADNYNPNANIPCSGDGTHIDNGCCTF